MQFGIEDVNEKKGGLRFYENTVLVVDTLFYTRTIQIQLTYY